MIINYKKFLSTRFDLVIRYYFLEKSNFVAIKAKKLALSREYNWLRVVFKKLLIIDVKTNSHSARKVRKLTNPSYGIHVAERLFSMTGWSWIEENISNNWMKTCPYPIEINGLGMSAKRFMISLKYDKKLYWMFTRMGKNMLALWDENLYKELLTSSQFEGIIKSKNNMMDKMARLNFFSDETYVGDKKLYNKYIKNL